MKCPKCGNENLQFVNTIVQDGKESFYLTALQYIFAVLFTIAFVLFLFIFPQAEKVQNVLLSTVMVKVVVYCLSALLVISMIKSFVPYKTRNVIQGVCPNCGHVENLSTLCKNQNNEDDTEEDIEDVEEDKSDTI